MFQNTRSNYGLIAQVTHWITATLVLFLFGLGIVMTQLPTGTEEQVSNAFFWFSAHKSLGVIVLLLSVFRILWALTNQTPTLLNGENFLEAFAAKVVHWLLYFTILAMPLTGWLEHSATQGFANLWWWLPQRIPFVPQVESWVKFWGMAHFFSAWFMGAAVFLHIAGAMKHLVIDKDDTVRRMLPFISKRDYPDLGHGAGSTSAKLVASGLVLSLVGFVIFAGLPDGKKASQAVKAQGSETAQSEVIADSKQNAIAPTWTVIAEQSELSISFIQSDSPASGIFQKWDADIQFDPAAPEQARLRVAIDIASLELGSLTDQALSSSYLDAGQYPEAVFRSEGFEDLGEGKFSTAGTLSLAGVEQPLTLTFDLAIEDGVATVSGQATIMRLQFGVGEEGGNVGNEVSVQFNLKANQSSEADSKASENPSAASSQTGTQSIDANWAVVAEQSELAINFVQSDSPTKGIFQTWDADIQFDPAAPEQARLRVAIDMASLDLGSLTDQALSSSYLDASQFPEAIFRSEGFEDLGNGKFSTAGTLSLAGVEQPLTLSFDLAIKDGVATVSGQATILRLQFGVGEEGGNVGKEVAVEFNLKANHLDN